MIAPSVITSGDVSSVVFHTMKRGFATELDRNVHQGRCAYTDEPAKRATEPGEPSRTIDEPAKRATESCHNCLSPASRVRFPVLPQLTVVDSLTSPCVQSHLCS